MHKSVRDRILKLALDGTKTRQIASRLGLTYDNTRRLLQRAESSGEIPPGTVERCSDQFIGRIPKTIDVAVNEQRLKSYIPPRATAAEMGSCSACQDVTEVVIEAAETDGVARIRLCRHHLSELKTQLESVEKKSKETRRIQYNSTFKR